MTWTFSKRCKHALQSKQIKVTFPRAVRNRIWKALQEFDDTYLFEPRFAQPYFRSLLEDLEKDLQAELGLDDLMAFPEGQSGPPEATNLEGFVLRGSYPPYCLTPLKYSTKSSAMTVSRNFKIESTRS
jgi:hypothetical protein